MKNYKKNKGITLIALVIIIIILLILAGITIASLTGENGLISKISQSRRAEILSEMKEQLTIAIDELQIEIDGNTSLKDITQSWIDNAIPEINSVVEKQIDYIKITMRKDKITGIFLLDNNLDFIEIEEENGIQIIYSLDTYKDNLIAINMTIISEESNLTQIILPDNDILYCNEKNAVSIDYVMEQEEDYTFIIKTENGKEKTEIANFKKPKEPSINSEFSGYLTMSVDGVKLPEIYIDYEEREDFTNYYSLDDGKTWQIYTGPFEGTADTILAKSINKKCLDIRTEERTLTWVAKDALGVKSFDGDENTTTGKEDFRMVANPNVYSFLVDESTWELYIYVIFAINYAQGPYPRQLMVQFFNDENELIGTTVSPSYTPGTKNRESFKIPSGTKKVTFRSPDLGILIYDVRSTLSTPVISLKNDYPTLMADGTFKNIYEINYNNKLENVDNYYSEDNGETWNLYTGDIYSNSEDIKAKSISKEHPKLASLESELSLRTPIYESCILSSSYDGDEETFEQYKIFSAGVRPFPGIRERDGKCLFSVGEENWGKTIEVIFEHVYDYNWYSRCLNVLFTDENENKIDSYTCPIGNTATKTSRTFTIPEGTYRVAMYSDMDLKVYEVKLTE